MKTICKSLVFSLVILFAACSSDPAGQQNQNSGTEDAGFQDTDAQEADADADADDPDADDPDTCIPDTCELLASCGSFPDGCGDTLLCECAEGFTCEDESCVEVPTTAPTVVIEAAPDSETYETAATFEFSCPDDDCETLECALHTPDDDGSFTPCTSPHTEEDLSVGEYEFHVRGTNTAGDETIVSHAWEIVEFSTERQIRGGEEVVCVLETTGELDCFGEDPYQLSSAPDDSLYSAFDLGDGVGCGLTPSQHVECWGVTTNIVDVTPTDTQFTEISAGMYLACGVTLSGEIQCWGDDTAVPANGPYSTVSSNNRHICGIRTSGEIDCTSADDNDYGETDTPTGDGFVQINSGDRAICALHSSGTVSCWGDDGGWGDDGIISQQPTDIDDFTQISLAGSPACGIRENNRAVCWGPAFRFDSDRSGGDPPSTTEFEALGCGWLYCCGLTTDETIECWGEFDSDQIPE